MAKETKKTKNEEKSEKINFGLIVRPVIAVPHRQIDQTVETEQGKEQSVRKLFEDYVLGRLDPRQLGGGNYDEEGSEEVDPLNKPGLTFEEATQISDAGRKAFDEMKQRKKVADHPIESSQKQEKEEKPAPAEP